MNLRLVIWNCFRGTPEQRCAELAALRPDVAVLLESAAPAVESDNLAFHRQPNGLGTAVRTFGDYRVERARRPANASPSAVPLRIRGPIAFNLLAVWTFREPTYAHALSRVIDAYTPFIRSDDTVVAGDFNGNAIWDKDHKTINYTINAGRLEQECGLKSAYHAFTNEAPGKESQGTLYFQWNQERPYHIDYCFVPLTWKVDSAEVAGFDDFRSSDHRPLTVDVVPSRS